jgi:hypothetical protein
VPDADVLRRGETLILVRRAKPVQALGHRVRRLVGQDDPQDRPDHPLTEFPAVAGKLLHEILDVLMQQLDKRAFRRGEPAGGRADNLQQPWIERRRSRVGHVPDHFGRHVSGSYPHDIMS